MRKRNTLGPVRTRAMEIAETDNVGTIEIDTVGTAETGAKNTTEMDATGVAGEVAVGISMSATSPGSSKVSTIRGIDMKNKGRPHQRDDTDIYV